MFKIDYITSSKPVREEITGIKSNNIIKKQKKTFSFCYISDEGCVLMVSNQLQVFNFMAAKF